MRREIPYITKRLYQSRNMTGRTPEKVFKEGLTKTKKTATMKNKKAN